MENIITYPYCKVFVDIDNEVHIVTHTDKNRHGHAVEQNLGGGLIDFITLDLTEFAKEVVDLLGEIDGKNITYFNISYTKLKNKVFDIAETLDKKHRYLYFFLIGKLNNILTDIMLSDEEQITNSVAELHGIVRYQKLFNFAINLCLDAENLPNYTMAEKFVAFTTAYPDYMSFGFKTAFAVTPTYKGKLDFDKVKYLNKKEVDMKRASKQIRDLLTLIHTDSKGVSLASYTVIENLHEMLYFEFTEMLKRGVQVKKCKLCQRYYILQNKHETDFCDRIYKGRQTCKQFGSKQAYNKRVAADPVLIEEQRIYKKIYARGDRPFEKLPNSKFYNISFTQWSKIVSDLKKKYLSGEITGEELLDGIKE